MPISKATPPRVNGSVGLTPNSSDWMVPVSAKDPARPIVTPIAVIHSSLSQDQSQHMARSGAQGHADPNFACTPADAVGHQA